MLAESKKHLSLENLGDKQNRSLHTETHHRELPPLANLQFGPGAGPRTPPLPRSCVQRLLCLLCSPSENSL